MLCVPSIIFNVFNRAPKSTETISSMHPQNEEELNMEISVQDESDLSGSKCHVALNGGADRQTAFLSL